MPVLSTVAAACARAWGFTAGDLFAGAALALDFDKTTTLDSRITFTRATSGTYFDSSGVMQTASSGAARFDHRLESGSWVNKGLLIEEQRTNLFERSEELADAYWTNALVTVTNDDTTAPDGTTTAEKFLETTASGIHKLSKDIQITSTSASPTTVSIFINKSLSRTKGWLQVLYSAGTFPSFRIEFDLSAETVTPTDANGATVLSGSIQNCGSSWYRISVSGYTGNTNVVHNISLNFRNDAGNGSYAGDATKGYYLWGFQLEVGALPTSYIKTTTASVTRNADQASMTSTNFSDWYNATEGTMFAQFSVPAINASGTQYLASADNGSNNEVIRLAIISGNGRAQVRDGASDQFLSASGIAISANTTSKEALVYKVNDFAFSCDASTVETDTSGTLPTVDRLALGNSAAYTDRYLNGHLAKFYFWNTRKSNNFLTSITS